MTAIAMAMKADKLDTDGELEVHLQYGRVVEVWTDYMDPITGDKYVSDMNLSYIIVIQLESHGLKNCYT